MPRLASNLLPRRHILGATGALLLVGCSDDALNAEIFADHPDYSEFGQPNTTNDVDNVIGGEDDLTPYLLDVARMPDGAMLASKVIGVRTDLDADSCTLGNGMMPPMP